MEPMPKFNFTKEKIEEMRNAFNSLDIDKSGEIDYNEIMIFLDMAHVPKEYGEQVYFLFNGKENKGITFDNFISFFELLEMIEKEPYNAAKNIFEKIDRDHSGTINKDELNHFLQIFSVNLKPEELQEVFKFIDADHSDDISLEEIANFLDLN